MLDFYKSLLKSRVLALMHGSKQLQYTASVVRTSGNISLCILIRILKLAFKGDLSSVKILCCLYVYQPEHPRHPHITHSTIFPSSSLALGTRQIQFVPKFVSRHWIHLKQQRFSYPCFFHFAMRFLSAYPSLRQYSYSSLLIAFLL